MRTDSVGQAKRADDDWPLGTLCTALPTSSTNATELMAN